eukprot:gene11832-11920_t
MSTKFIEIHGVEQTFKTAKGLFPEIKGPGPERAVVFQNHSLLPWLTCFDNIYLAVERVFGGKETKAQLKARTDAALALVLTVDLPRPRKRVELAEDPQYVHYRKAVIDFLYTRQGHVEKAA